MADHLTTDGAFSPAGDQLVTSTGDFLIVGATVPEVPPPPTTPLTLTPAPIWLIMRMFLHG